MPAGTIALLSLAVVLYAAMMSCLADAPGGDAFGRGLALAYAAFLGTVLWLVLAALLVVAGVKGPIARAMYWINQNVLDAIVNGVATGAKGTARFLYRFVDQGAIDGSVNASGSAAEGSGQLLRGIQTGKISNYAALLFGGVVLIAGIFVIII